MLEGTATSLRCVEGDADATCGGAFATRDSLYAWPNILSFITS